MSQPDTPQADERLRLAQTLLQPQAIYLREQKVWCAEEFHPPFLDEDQALTPQFRDTPGRTFTRFTTETDADETVVATQEQHVVFPHEVGVRLLPAELVEERREGETIDEGSVVFELTATFVAQYRIAPNDLDKEEVQAALKRFAILNVAYHVWPYWRELIQSSCARVGIPAIPLRHWRMPSLKNVGGDNA